MEEVPPMWSLSGKACGMSLGCILKHYSHESIFASLCTLCLTRLHVEAKQVFLRVLIWPGRHPGGNMVCSSFHAQLPRLVFSPRWPVWIVEKYVSEVELEKSGVEGTLECCKAGFGGLSAAMQPRGTAEPLFLSMAGWTRWICWAAEYSCLSMWVVRGETRHPAGAS